MKKLLLALPLLLIGFNSLAQTNITGILTDSEETIPFANVTLHSLPDTTFVKGTATDDNGNFTIANVAKGSYMVKISYIGYQDFSKKIYIDGNAKEFKLGNVVIKAGILLEGAKVIGKTSAVTIKGDTVEYHPGAYKLQENAVVEDLLKKLPGVQVDKDGTVTAGGKEVTKVLIGGKEFFANDPTLATKNIPVKAIEKVQVLDRKSEQERLTGISDGEEETVINLDFKKGQQQGWMANVSSGLGRDIKNESGNKMRFDENMMVNRFTSNSRFTLMGNLNNVNSGRGGRQSYGGSSGNTTAGMLGLDLASYATDKLTIEGSGYFTYRNTENESSSTRETFLQDSSFFKNSQSLSNSYGRSYRADTRLTYKPNDYNTFVFRPEGSFSHSDSQSHSTSETLDGDGNPVNTNEQKTRSETKSSNYGARLDYSHNFGTSGRQLSFGARISQSKDDTNSENWNETNYHLTSIDSIRDQRSNTESTNLSYRFQVSYIEPLGKSKNHFLQARYEYNVSDRDQEKYTYSKDPSGNYTILDTAYSNSYENKYTNQQIHLSYRMQYEKFSLQVGFNINPQSSQSTRYIAGVQQNKQTRDVTNFGPMMRFQYNFTKSHNIRLDYRTSTGQPSLSQLDPLVDISNPLNIQYGNPDLKPSYTHSLNLRYNINNRSKMRSLMMFVRGSVTQNSIVSKSFYNSDGTQESTYDNVNGVWGLDAFATATFPLNMFFQLTSSSRMRLSQRVSFDNGEKNTSRSDMYAPNLGFQYNNSFMDLGIGGTIAFTNTRNSISTNNDKNIRDYTATAWTTVYLPWNISFVSDISFQKGSGYSQGYDTKQTVWNAGIEKGIFKNQATIKFSVNDILRDKKNITYTSNNNYIQQSINNTLNCYFMVSLTYRLNVFAGQKVSGGQQQMGGPGGMGGGRMRMY